MAGSTPSNVAFASNSSEKTVNKSSHLDDEGDKCEGGDLVDIETNTLAQEELLQQKYRCEKNCGKESMSYDEGVQHLGTCNVSDKRTKIEKLLDQMDGDDQPLVWEDASRCKKCKCIPFAPVFFCNCQIGLYCTHCRAHDEKCTTCNTLIRSTAFMDSDQFMEKVFKFQIKKFLCRFCEEAYTWDALAVHERICFINANKDQRKDLIHNCIKKNFLEKEEYCEKMIEIYTDVQEKLAERLTQYEHEFIKSQQIALRCVGKELPEERKELIRKKIDKMKNDEAKEKAIKEFKNLIENYHDTLEPPSKDQNEFIKFKKFDKIFSLFKFNKKVVNPGTQYKLHKYSRPLIQEDGFKIVQTPLSNRVFLVGGDANPWGTFEFDLDQKTFLPEKTLLGGKTLNNPLSIGRSHHSLAATRGLIFCTGGKSNYLRLQSDPELETQERYGKIIEVFNLRKGEWMRYNSNLQNARCCHSSCILGNYLYLFHGYDVANYAINSMSIERIRIDTNEATIRPDPGFKACYAVQDNILHDHVRPFTAVYPTQNQNQIIYFGYSGLEENIVNPLDQKDLIWSDKKNQKYYMYSFRDEHSRYHEHNQQLEWEQEENEESVRRISDKIQESQKIESLNKPLSEEYIHHSMYFRGITFYHSNVEKLCYFDDEEGFRIKEVPNPEKQADPGSSSDSD